MARRKKWAMDVEAFWLANPDASHDDCVAAMKRKYRRADNDEIRLTSYSSYSRLSKGTPSRITIARRKRTIAANSNGKGLRSPRLLDETAFCRKYWQEHWTVGSHEECVGAAKTAGFNITIIRSYQGRSYARRLRQDHPDAATLPVVRGGDHTEARQRADEVLVENGHGRLAERMQAAKDLLDEATTGDPFEAPSRMKRAMKELEICCGKVETALASI